MKLVCLDKIRFFKKYIKLIILALAAISCFWSVTVAINSKNDEAVSPNEKAVPSSARENRKYNALILGVDEAAKLTDVMMLVSFDTKHMELTVAQLPRDTYFEYTANAYRKLNGALKCLADGAELSSFLGDALGIKIDYYVQVDLNAVSKAVDQLGGVELNVSDNMAYNDPSQELEIELRAGKQTLSGEEAVKFIRYREGYVRGDIARLDAQKLFLAALGETIMKRGVLGLAAPVMTLISNSESNMSYSDCMRLATAAMSVEPSNIRILTVSGGEVQTAGGTWYYILNRNEAYKTMKRYFVGDDKLAEYTIEAFDKNKAFTGDYSSRFNDIYYATNGYESEVYTAERLNSEGIMIDRTEN